MAAAPEPFIDYWRSTRQRLDDAFSTLVPRFFPQLPAIGGEAVVRVLADGKWLRGCLLCLVNDAFSGQPEAAVPRALAVECVHAASLIHDDLVDGDTLRRGRPATWAVVGPRKAVLLGDVIFATALQRMVELSPDDGIALAEAIAIMADGAYREPLEPAELAGVAHREALYPTIIYLKTGALFATAARMGALAAGAPPALVEAAFVFGRQLGEAYQIADDLRDLVDGDVRPPSLAALLPAALHFCDDSCTTSIDRLAAGEELRHRLDALRPLLRRRMQVAIEARLRAAGDAARAFPESASTPLLRSAPAEVVGMMLHG